MAKRSADGATVSNHTAAGKQKTAARATNSARASIRADLPPNPTVRVLFHGLMCLCVKTGRHFEMGFFNNAPGHALRIIVWETSTSCKLSQLIVGGDVATNMRLDVRQAAINGLWLYQKGAQFNRDPEKDDYRDFRWVLDLEGQEFYGQKLPNKKGSKLKPRLRLTNGIFHTAYRTNSEFKVKQGRTERSLGHVAEYVAANIYLAEGGYVSLKIDGAELRLKEDSGKTYQIDFLNDCPTCDYGPPDRPRNDFNYYRETFDVASGMSTCELVLDRGADPSEPDFCYIGDIPFSSDKSPCTMAYFGQSNTLDE